MQASISWLTDPTVYAVNRLPAHSDHRFYRSLPELASGASSLVQSLDGLWRFAYSSCPAQRPENFWQTGADLSGFGSIRVPGHIELQGYGQRRYVNTQYPWDGHKEIHPPEIDWDDCPVGSYVRDFTLDPGLDGQRVCISFQGVEPAFYLWCNGQFVGYAEDSFTPSDFDLTPFVHPGVNRLCVQVFKYASAAWLEDQDMFRFFGIFRSVFLYAKPAVHLDDLWLQATLAQDNTTGLLTPRLKLSAEAGTDADACRVNCRITGPDGQLLYDAPLQLTLQNGYHIARTISLPDIRPWTHDTPVLYTVELTIHDAGGNLLEVVPYRTGFRRFEMINGVMCLNGERIVFRGVNRHEWNPVTGRAIGAEDMRRAMATFRRNNINAVRTCHYPDQSMWYDLCDENGIYMIAEANLETHGTWQGTSGYDLRWHVPGDLPQWKDCCVDRARSLFEQDKNHTAILLWSCGNESYAGADIQAMSDFFHANDPGRLVHYEGVFHNRKWDACSDVESRMYAKPAEIRAYLESKPAKPFLLCEYMHDMGNSLGGMESYIRLEEEFAQYQGGFIWDYMDQALWHTDARGRRVLGYGGDFGERPTDYAFSANGLVFADGSEKPALQEVRYWYAPAGQRAAWDAANAAAAASADADLAGLQQRQQQDLARMPALQTARGITNLGVRGQGFEVLFGYPQGGPVSLRCGGQEWLWRAPQLALWRAPTENDLGNGFPLRASVWKAADSWQKCTGREVLEETEQKFVIRFAYELPAVPDAKASITYTVDAAGRMTVEANADLPETAPELPCFGVRFETPLPLEEITWQGLSGETYPDRYKGAAFGVFTEAPHIPDYLVPQECGCHVATRRAMLRREGHTLELQACGAPFAFSALPYTPHQLEAAAHREELSDPVRTTVSVFGAMRGVGGIDSWGTDVEPPYHVTGKQLQCRFVLQLTAGPSL